MIGADKIRIELERLLQRLFRTNQIALRSIDPGFQKPQPTRRRPALDLRLQSRQRCLIVLIEDVEIHQLIENGEIVRCQRQRGFKVTPGLRVLPLLSQHHPKEKKRLRILRRRLRQSTQHRDGILRPPEHAIPIRQQNVGSLRIGLALHQTQHRADDARCITLAQLQTRLQHDGFREIRVQADCLFQGGARPIDIGRLQIGHRKLKPGLGRLGKQGVETLQFLNRLRGLALRHLRLSQQLTRPEVRLIRVENAFRDRDAVVVFLLGERQLRQQPPGREIIGRLLRDLVQDLLSLLCASCIGLQLRILQGSR